MAKMRIFALQTVENTVIAPGNEVLPWETKTAEIRLMTSVRKSQGSPAFFALHIEESPVARPMISRTIRRKKYVNITIINFSGWTGYGSDMPET